MGSLVNIELVAVPVGELPATRWALVTVLNPDGSLNREFTVTAQDAEAVTTKNAVPPGVTAEEHSACLWSMVTKVLDQNMALAQPDGKLLINQGTTLDAKTGRYDTAFVQADPQEWSPSGQNVVVADAVAALLPVDLVIAHDVPIVVGA